MEIYDCKMNKFKIRLVHQGDSYGIDYSLINKDTEVLVEIIDNREGVKLLNRFITRRYHVSSVFEDSLVSDIITALFGLVGLERIRIHIGSQLAYKEKSCNSK